MSICRNDTAVLILHRLRESEEKDPAPEKPKDTCQKDATPTEDPLTHTPPRSLEGRVSLRPRSSTECEEYQKPNTCAKKPDKSPKSIVATPRRVRRDKNQILQITPTRRSDREDKRKRSKDTHSRLFCLSGTGWVHPHLPSPSEAGMRPSLRAGWPCER